MKPKTVEALAWVLLYGGLLMLVLGLAVARADDALAWGLGLLGGVIATAGVVLIGVRSRMGDG
jgi:hypothetical protein